AVELVRDEPPARTGETVRERVAVLLGRRADGSGVDVALEHEGSPEPPELVELAAPVFAAGATPATWVAVLPSPVGGEEARWLASVVQPGRARVAPVPGAAAPAEVVAAAVRQLAAQAETANLAVAPLAPPPVLPDVEATRRALVDRTAARRGLYTLAMATGA